MKDQDSCTATRLEASISIRAPLEKFTRAAHRNTGWSLGNLLFVLGTLSAQLDFMHTVIL